MSYAATVLADSPVSYWRFQESSGTTAADVQGANPGTYVGTPTLGLASPIATDPNAKALGLNGSSQYVSAPDAASLRFTTPFSLEAWINPTDRLANYPWIGKWASNLGYIMWLDSGTGNVLYLRDAGSSSLTTVIPTATWSHVVVTNTAGTINLYVNGTNVRTITDVSPSSSTAEFRIGNYVGGTFFKGSVAEVAVYNTALPAVSVSAHYAAALPDVFSVSDPQATRIPGIH